MNFQRLLFVVIALALASVGFAYPNFNATTGIAAVPTAMTVTSGALDGAADILLQDDTTFLARAIYGLSPNFEVGAQLGLGDNTQIGITGKYRLPVDVVGGLVSVGLSLADAGQDQNGFQLFVVGSKAMTTNNETGLIGTLGVTFTNFNDLTGIMPFAGAEFRLSDGLEFDGEFVLEAGDFTDSTFSLLLRKRFNSAWSGQLGFTNATGFFVTADEGFFLGASYAFGTVAE